MPAAELHGYKGNAGDTTIVTALGPTDNVITLASATIAATWPDGSDGVFYADLDNGTTAFEKVKVTSRSGVTLSGVARGQDGTVAVSHAATTPIRHVFTADDARISNAHAATPAQGELDHTTLLNNVRHDTATRHPTTVLPMSTTVTTSAPGDAGSAGTSADLAHGDHKHAREAAGTTYGSPVASAVGDASADGVAASVPHSDHKHARETFAAPAASAVGDAGTTGTATTVPHSDHKHAREGFGAVTTQTAFGAASATGTATTVAHSDHAHGTPAITFGDGTASGTVTTTSTSYTDLSAAGPSFSVTVGLTGVLWVAVGAAANSDGNATALIGFTLSGANTLAASDINAYSVNGTNNMRGSRTRCLVGLTAGATTITAVYKSNNGANTASFSERVLSALSF
jgi:hypothetical protein